MTCILSYFFLYFAVVLVLPRQGAVPSPHQSMSTRPEILPPCRCFCGKPLGHLFAQWQDGRRVATNGTRDDSARLTKLGLIRYCCRRMMISHTEQATVPVAGSFVRPARP